MGAMVITRCKWIRLRALLCRDQWQVWHLKIADATRKHAGSWLELGPVRRQRSSVSTAPPES